MSKEGRAFKIFMGLATTINFGNLYLILASEHGMKLLAAETTFGIAFLGYKFYQAGLKGKEIEVNNAKSKAEYIKSLEIENQVKSGYTFWH